MSKKKLPNVVVILADDLGVGDVSCFNPKGKITTPCMDKLAEEGRIFVDAHSNSAVCTPTRYGLLTGRYCWRTRLKKGVLYGFGAPLIENSRETMASCLKKAGYTTACVGKWHLGLDWVHRDGSPCDEEGGHYDPAKVDYSRKLRSGPHTLGFDHSFIISASLDMDPYVFIENGVVTELPTRTCKESARPAYYRGGVCAPSFQHETCLLELTRYAESFIERQRDSEDPFFLYFPTPSPHTPHLPRKPFQGSTDLGAYGDFVVEHDWSVGRIIEALDRNGLREDTLVICTSDNGAHASPLNLEEKGHHCNSFYRGQKSDAWDGGHRVPFIARWPGVIPADSECRQLICLTDLMRSCAAWADQPLAEDAAEDSYDCRELFTEESPRAVRPDIVHHSIDGSFALRDREWKLIDATGSGGWSLPNDEAKRKGMPALQLYHMGRDVGEETNLGGTETERARSMLARLDVVRAGVRTAPV